MKPISYILIIFIGLGISVDTTTTAGDSFTDPKRINFSPDRPALPGEILVKFKPATFEGSPTQVNETVQTSQASVNAIFTQLRVKAMRPVFRTTQTPLGDIYRLRFEAPVPLLEALKQMAGDPNVEWVEPNYLSFTFAAPNDTYLYLQWGLEKIQADLAWDISQGDPSIVIAVIDTGVDYDHPDLADNIWHNSGEIPDNGVDDDGNGYEDDDMGWDFVSVTAGADPAPDPNEDIAPPDPDPMDFHGHGTHCAGIASAVTDNGIGIAGTAWNCKIMALRAGYKTSEGDGALADSDSAEALHYAADNGAHVISMSWGSPSLSYTLETAIQYAQSQSNVLVAAAGNENTDSQHYPAAYPGVIAVAASDENDGRPSFSNYGSWVDIAAPGTIIYSTMYDDTYVYMSGTSMATPLVAGVTGLILSQDPTLTADAVTQRLLDSADGINWGVAGPTKRLNAYQALFSSPPRTIHVDNTIGNDTTGDGSSGNPYGTIQKGIDEASDGDTVLAADGTYTGTGNVNLDFGGKAITVRSENGAANSIIDCENTPNTRGFYFQTGETLDSVVDGFTIRNGKADFGGGIYCGINSSPTITNNIITGNSADLLGGGIFYYSSPTITKNTVTGNSANYGGGGIFSSGSSSATITKNTITGNSTGGSGGGIFCESSSLTITNNIIAGNSADYYGGGIFSRFNSSPTMTNNTITGNSAGYSGGGIYCWDGSSATITNTILWDNSPQEIYFSASDDPNTVTISYSDVQGGEAGIVTNGNGIVNWLAGNIDADPLFVDATNDDYHLSDDSPCIGAGTSDGAPATDIEGNPRPNPPGSSPDMGAYESPLEGNAPPVASNLGISPLSPKTGDDLTGSYDYSDADNDPESGSEIRWYRNDVLQTDYDDTLTVPSDATSKGETGYFTIKPSDGKDFGTLQTSPTVTIGNTVPVASNLSISPEGDGLTGSYDYSDADDDPESGSEIRWYKDDVLQPDYNDTLTVPWSATEEGQEWYFTLKPSDGEGFGILQISAPVTLRGLHLYPGWNLISASLDIADTDILSVLAPLEGNVTSVWAYDAASGSWKRYIPDGPDFLNDLDTIEHGKGYWINMTDEATLPITGEQITDTAIQLRQGWNLVGYNSSTIQLREDALSSISGKYTSIWTYHGATGQWLRYVIGTPDFLNTLTQLEPKKGYWINVEENCEWIVLP